MAPFLQQETDLSDGFIGTILSLQWLVMTFAGSLGGTIADHVERQYPGKGRPWVMQVGVLVGTMGYLGHGIHHFWLSAITESFAFHLTMRLLFAVANALTAPVLDGLTIAYLEQQETLYGDGDDSSGGMGKADFGKERLYGAISWAMGNVMAGLLIDSFGFVTCVFRCPRDMHHPISILLSQTFQQSP